MSLDAKVKALSILMVQLNKSLILSLINDEISEQIELEIHQQLESTNTYLLEQPLGTKVKICIAESQTNGKGRHGKFWNSPKGANIYLSFAHRLEGNMTALYGWSLVVGITLAETLQKYCDDKLQLKWPNDLLVKGKKLSGILVEIKKETSGTIKLISGLGINIYLPEELVMTIGQPVANLCQSESKGEMIRNRVVADVITSMINNFKIFEEHGFSAFHTRWNSLDAWYKKSVILLIGTNTIKGIHEGVDATGALLLNQDGKVTSWSSGEVSLRSDS